MRKYLRHVSEIEGRITTGVAMVIAIAVALWPDQPRPFSIEKATGVVICVIAWLFANLSGGGRPAAHDVALFQKYRDQVTDGHLDFLRHNDFAVSFTRSNIDGIREINYWDGPRYEFMDAKVQVAWREARTASEEFLGFIAEYTAPMRYDDSRATVHPHNGDPENPADWVIDQYEKLNETSTVLHSKLETFERTAHQRLII